MPASLRSSPAADAGLAERLGELEQRFARLESALDDLTSLLDRLPAAIASFTDLIDGLDDRGLDLNERVQGSLRILERVTAPDNLQRLDRLLDRVSALASLLESAGQVPGLIGAGVDLLDEWMERLAEAGIDVDERGRILAQALERLTSPEALDVLRTLLARVDVIRGVLDSGVLDAEPVAIVGKAGEGLARTAKADPPSVGPFALLRALRDPDIQRSLGFVLHFARIFGRSLADGHGVKTETR
jgi:uncharacterized protein YjgD (DUF1641 family)